MGKGLSKVTPKYIRDFNIENRAHKFIENENIKTKIAPRYPSTVDLLKDQEGNYNWQLDLFINLFLMKKKRQKLMIFQ